MPSSVNEMRRQRVKIESIDIEAAVEKAKAMIELEQNLSPAFKSTIEILLLLVAFAIEPIEPQQ